jgi:hypothetical protein
MAYSGAVEWYLCVSEMGGAAVEGLGPIHAIVYAAGPIYRPIM